MKLSDLNNGDTFTFIEGQTARYHTGSTNHADYETISHVIYEVLKKNPMSVKVKPISGRVEFVFKFAGFFNANEKVAGIDCLVEIKKGGD